MKKLLILLLLGCFACQNVEKVEKPKNLIPEDKMVEVLTELSLLNAAKSFSMSIFEDTGIEPSEYLYDKFNIDSLQLTKSNEYYAVNIEEYQKIYERVKQNLEAIKTKNDSLLKIYREEQEKLFKDKSRKNGEIADSIIQRRRIFNLVKDVLPSQEIPKQN